jgi:hydrogenase maturation protease
VILVAGIGNIFLGDDGFGSEVARRISERATIPNARVIDFGIRGVDLLYALVDSYEATIIIDALLRGGEPGTLYVIEPDITDFREDSSAVEPHAMDPMRILGLARSMGASLSNVRIVGCEPATFGPPDEGQMGLSVCVSAAVERAVDVVEELITEILGPAGATFLRASGANSERRLR